MDLRLAIRTHATDHAPEFVLLEGDGCNQRVQRRLARLQVVGVAGIQVEVSTAVLQHHAGVTRDHARAEHAIQAVNQGHRIALGVDRCDKHSVAAQTAVRRHFVPRQGARRVHQAAALVCVGLGNQALHRHVSKGRVGQMAVTVVISDLLGLHQRMHMVRA